MDESTEVSSAGASAPQLTDFLQIFERQMQAAEAREQRLATMLQSAIQSAGRTFSSRFWPVATQVCHEADFSGPSCFVVVSHAG